MNSKSSSTINRAKDIHCELRLSGTWKPHQKHMLLMGLPGTAKSQFAMNVFGSIDGARTFGIHLTKQTTEEYVFGPINIEELKKGNVIHNTKDSILDADFAFIDEFFDASDV